MPPANQVIKIDPFAVSPELMREIDALIAIHYYGYEWREITKRHKELRSTEDFVTAVVVEKSMWREIGYRVPHLPRYTQDPAFVFPLMIEIARIAGDIHYVEYDGLTSIGKLWRVDAIHPKKYETSANARTLPIAVGLMALKLKDLVKPSLSCLEYLIIGKKL